MRFLLVIRRVWTSRDSSIRREHKTRQAEAVGTEYPCVRLSQALHNLRARMAEGILEDDAPLMRDGDHV